jgi:Carboxymuconolactone decarboxylase family
MVQLASLIASQALREYRVMVGAALTVGVTPVEVKEIVYQAVPYVGMAKVFDFIHATNEVLTERGVALPLPGQSTTTPETREEKGLAVQKQMVGSDVVEKLYASARRSAAHPALFVGQLLRRLLDPHRHRRAHARAPHLQHARGARRMRRAGQGTCRREPQCGQ